MLAAWNLARCPSHQCSLELQYIWWCLLSMFWHIRSRRRLRCSSCPWIWCRQVLRDSESTPERSMSLGLQRWMDLNHFEMFASSCDRLLAVKCAKAKNYHRSINSLGLQCTRSFDSRHCLRTPSPGFRWCLPLLHDTRKFREAPGLKWLSDLLGISAGAGLWCRSGPATDAQRKGNVRHTMHGTKFQFSVFSWM